MIRKHTLQRVALGSLVVGLALSLTGCFPHPAEPTQVGVRTIKLTLFGFGDKGVEPDHYPGGPTYWFPPIINDWHTFDTRLQNLEMTISAARGDRRGRDDLPFKTIDGNDISLDMIISYRIVPQDAPMILQHVAENDEDLKNNIVRIIARSTPRDIFGELLTEDFYDAKQRTIKAEAVKEKLNEILAVYGVTVTAVSPKDYRFNPEYQRAIEDKKVADQQVEKNKASASAAEEEYKKRVEEAKGDVGKMRAAANGEFERAKIEADAYYIQQTRLAEAIEAEGRAEAEGILRMNEALSGAGGEAMVKIAIAEALLNKKIMLLPIGGGGIDVRSTDINELLQLYGIQQITGTSSK